MSNVPPELIIDILSYLSVKSLYRFSFGYVESIDDYKVVRVLTKNIMHIFSLRNNSWKIVEGNFPFEQPNILGGVSLNGSLHWGTISYPNDLGVITGFDLAEEKFKTFPLPDIPNPPQPCECMVRVFGEYLCVAFGTYNEFSGIRVEKGFWIMKEYGVKESWIRIVISHNPFDLYVPLCFWENDGIIISSDFGKRVFCYEKDGKNRKELLFDRGYHIFTYEETLVSPNNNIELCTVTAAILNSFPRTPDNEPEPAKPYKLELRCCPISQ
ncbi:hypothetical protein EZV62_016665 [Acer yangbiense]|uniref:F-box domain-containing protein n=1 Tax=Acer yangbiense TaxID=1000413 RepID=A0A5C7HRB1_9ROSI|nr:hypothetical protein EZV62_016665 [Acer yangbiense]